MSLPVFSSLLTEIESSNVPISDVKLSTALSDAALIALTPHNNTINNVNIIKKFLIFIIKTVP